ncbi:MAG: hypothetical protein U0X91_16685 [Spirosomataceae bacterium]
MKKQIKKLEFRKEQVMSFSAMRHIIGGVAGQSEDTLCIVVGTGVGGGPHLITSVGVACPTMVQPLTKEC